MAKIRRYSELVRLPTFEERFRYLELGGEVGARTFGGDRWLNQAFYRSKEWRRLRREIIVRDMACDLGHPDYELVSGIFIHHMNPVTVEDLKTDNIDYLLDPEYLIVTCDKTHNAIHYGGFNQLPRPFAERRPGDTKLW